jgi:dolichyl-diphosphooligosaccharide--protein glycosyltransferase
MDKSAEKRATTLALILLAAFALRMVTFKYTRFLVFDPAHHYAVIRHIVEAGEFPSPFPLSKHPVGGVVQEPMGFYYLTVFLYRLLAPLGFSLFTIFRAVSPVFGALTLIPLYLLARDVWGHRTAFYSILFLAFLPGHAYRTFSGFYRGDAFAAFFMAMGLYLFHRSLGPNYRKGIGLSILAGVSLGAMGLVWNGFPFGFVVLSAFAVLCSMASFLRDGDHRLSLNYFLASGIGIAIIKYSMLLQPHVEHFLEDLARYIFPATMAALIVLELLKRPFKTASAKRRALALSLLTLASLVSVFRLFPQLLQRFLSGYGLVQAGTAFTRTIGELQPITSDVYLDKFGIAGVMFVLGLVYLSGELLREQPPGKILVLTWSLGCLYLMGLAVRFSFLASLPIALVSGLALSRLAARMASRLRRGEMVLVPLVLVLMAYQGIQFADSMEPDMTPYWQEALDFLATQEAGGVFTWWDYGSWIQGVTGFPTILDTVTGQSVGRMREVGGILLETDATAVDDFFEKYYISYVVVSTDMIGQMHNVNSILGRPQLNYIIIKSKGSTTLGGTHGTVYGDNVIVLDPGDARIAIAEVGEKHYLIRSIAYRDGDSLEYRRFTESDLPFYEGTIYVSRQDLFIPFGGYYDFALYMKPELERTLLTSTMLLDGRGFPSLEMIYRNPQVRVYRVRKTP